MPAQVAGFEGPGVGARGQALDRQVEDQLTQPRPTRGRPVRCSRDAAGRPSPATARTAGRRQRPYDRIHVTCGITRILHGVRVASGKFWSDIAEQRLCAFGGRVLIAATTVRTVLPVRGGGGRGGGGVVLRGAAGTAALVS